MNVKKVLKGTCEERQGTKDRRIQFKREVLILKKRTKVETTDLLLGMIYSLQFYKKLQTTPKRSTVGQWFTPPKFDGTKQLRVPVDEITANACLDTLEDAGGWSGLTPAKIFAEKTRLLALLGFKKQENSRPVLLAA